MIGRTRLVKWLRSVQDVLLELGDEVSKQNTEIAGA